jgi:hypothetical protein
VAVKSASEPMQIALLVDDNGTGIFRAGVARFIQRLLGHAEFALRAADSGPASCIAHPAPITLYSSFTAMTRHRHQPPGTQRDPPCTWIAIGPSVMPPAA